MVVIICALLAVGAIGFTLLVRERDIPPVPAENPELKHREKQRQVLYENLRDLQFEYHQGKLSEADYQSLKRGFLNDLAGVMASIEQLQPEKEETETEKDRTVVESDSRQKHTAKDPDSPLICSTCGAASAAHNRFCSQCGAALL